MGDCVRRHHDSSRGSTTRLTTPPRTKTKAMSVTLEESYAYCTLMARRRARNFYFSFLGLPGDQFRAMCVLYAFMRIADDLGDDPDVPVARRAVQLDEWLDSLQRALELGDFDHPVFPALRDIVETYAIPAEYLSAVVDGVRMDLNPTPYPTFEDLSRYCYHVAGCVGICCIHIWGYEDEQAIPCAVDCGLAFQLTNILRDLGEDAAMGRIYLPSEDLERFGYSREDLTNHTRNEAFMQLMQFEVARAESYYRRAEKLFDYLKPSGKPVLHAMLRIYGGLLAEIERRDYDVFSRHVSLSTWRKLVIAADSLFRRRL